MTVATLPVEAKQRARLVETIEWALLALLILAGLITLAAGPTPSPEKALAEPFGLFYRRAVVVTLGARQISWPVVGAAIGAVLIALSLWRRPRPEVHAVAAAYGLFLVLAPVLNYGPQIERLKLLPADAVILSNLPLEVILALPQYNEFRAWLPVTTPLAVCLLLLVAWVALTPRRSWPPSFVAAAGLFGWATVGSAWLIASHLAARGVANQLAYTYWPGAMASVWTIAQLLLAVAAVCAAGRQSRLARILCAAAGLLLVAGAVIGRGPL